MKREVKKREVKRITSLGLEVTRIHRGDRGLLYETEIFSFPLKGKTKEQKERVRVLVVNRPCLIPGCQGVVVETCRPYLVSCPICRTVYAQE